MALHEEEERICRQLGNLDRLAASLGSQANILYTRGQLDQAMALHKEEEGICRQLGNLASLAASLGNQAVILKAGGQLDQAMACTGNRSASADSSATSTASRQV